MTRSSVLMGRLDVGGGYRAGWGRVEWWGMVWGGTQSCILKVISSLKNKDHVVEPKGTAPVQHSKLNANYDLKYVKCNGCMLSDNHDLCVLDFINNVNARVKSRSVKKNSKRKEFTTTEVPLRKSSALDNKTPKPVVTLVYSRKPRKSKTSVLFFNSNDIKALMRTIRNPSRPGDL
ncbi:hypothetical protein Tco_0545371 [Tanacetum coccineum]